ncbi:MAG: MAPEG family protein [Woeseia sp.]
MESIAIVTVLALVQYLVFSYQVSLARIKHSVRAPAMTGHPEFERAYRVHQNTLEQIVVFVPALWMFAVYVHALTGAIIGLLFPLGRYIYGKSYMNDPSRRAAGFTIGAASTAILLTGAAIGALISWIRPL